MNIIGLFSQILWAITKLDRNYYGVINLFLTMKIKGGGCQIMTDDDIGGRAVSQMMTHYIGN